MSAGFHRAALIAVRVLVLSVASTTAVAHGFRERIDLPLPIPFYYGSAGIAVALSFVAVAFLADEQRGRAFYHTYQVPMPPGIASMLSGNVTRWCAKLLVLTTTIAVVTAGFVGQQIAPLNILPTVVWVLFAVALAYFSAIFGNVWREINPAATLYELFEHVTRTHKRSPISVRAVESWPAVALFLVYRWIENAYPHADRPSHLAAMVVLYAVLTCAGMHACGREVWLEHCDPFAKFFGLLSKLSCLRVARKDGTSRLTLNLPGSQLLDAAKLSASEVAFVMLMLSSIAFDALRGTDAWNRLAAGAFGDTPLVVANTFGLLGFWIAFAAIFLACMALTRRIAHSPHTMKDFAGRFALTLLPIAVAYEFAHYLSLLLVDGQRLIYLVSDPLGDGYGLGWNLFGTAGYAINYKIISLERLWYWQIAAIVTAHVFSVFLAHTRARELWGNGKPTGVTRELPMLALMISYTVFSLWTLALPVAP